MLSLAGNSWFLGLKLVVWHETSVILLLISNEILFVRDGKNNVQVDILQSGLRKGVDKIKVRYDRLMH